MSGSHSGRDADSDARLIQFVDVHGRLCERLVVSDVLQRVYASSAPGYEEIMDPKWCVFSVLLSSKRISPAHPLYPLRL